MLFAQYSGAKRQQGAEHPAPQAASGGSTQLKTLPLGQHLHVGANERGAGEAKHIKCGAQPGRTEVQHGGEQDGGTGGLGDGGDDLDAAKEHGPPRGLKPEALLRLDPGFFVPPASSETWLPLGLAFIFSQGFGGIAHGVFSNPAPPACTVAQAGVEVGLDVDRKMFKTACQ